MTARKPTPRGAFPNPEDGWIGSPPVLDITPKDALQAVAEEIAATPEAPEWVGSLPEVTLGPPREGIRVTLCRRVRNAGEREVVEEPFDWPRGWPFPDQGTVVLGREIGGFVNNVELDLVNEKVVIWLRPQ